MEPTPWCVSFELKTPRGSTSVMWRSTYPQETTTFSSITRCEPWRRHLRWKFSHAHALTSSAGRGRSSHPE